MMADFSAVGGLLLLAAGLRICGIKMFAVVNMLPALLLAMPLFRSLDGILAWRMRAIATMWVIDCAVCIDLKKFHLTKRK